MLISPEQQAYTNPHQPKDSKEERCATSFSRIKQFDQQVGEEAFEMLLQVLSGQMTKNEALSYFGSVDIFCLGPVI